MRTSKRRQKRRPTIRANVTVRNDLRPGDIGALTFLHGSLYAKEYSWDHTFEAYVAGPLSEFAKSPSPREKIWVVEKDGKIAGSVAIVEVSLQDAQLRWLLLHPDLRGQGMGKKLTEEALRFCRACGYRSVFLWTEKRLNAAAQLYRVFGFKLTEEKTHKLWGTTVTEQRYELNLS
ncbi:MAG: GNAT family N-acetyltransferase [Ignavibacteriales bacterium]|nr:GNAT family N-acetyltransferase [Ignavibacteriales bacterium]MBI3004205.1 GNAT family N-acetyltransferase [Ignavibacteriales bacterium]